MIYVPPVSLKLLPTKIGILNFFPNSTALVSITPAPRCAISIISSYEILSSNFASLYLLGSTLYIPSTSVYILHSHPKAAARATALVSDPPLPRVVISPSSLTPWNPVTMTTFPSFRWLSILSTSILFILLFVCIPIVFTFAWEPVSDTAFSPSAFNAIARSVTVCCSPVDKRESSSLWSGFEEISLAIFIKASVVFPIAEATTTISSYFSFFSLLIYPEIAFIFSIVATLEPPYFNTTLIKNLLLKYFC